MICDECTARTDPDCDHVPTTAESCMVFFNSPCGTCGFTPCRCAQNNPALETTAAPLRSVV